MPTKPSYNDTLKYLYSLEKYGIRLGLERINALLKSLDNPQDKLNIIHVAGTNGKGSTSAIIASILLKAGYKVGLYTSPHLVRFNERIRINGKEITDRKIAELVERVKKRSQESEACPRMFLSGIRSQKYTFFEFTTAMAFLYFAEEGVDFAVMEVGLGGRLDATNAGSPIVSIITNIEKDHEAMLGSRIEDIASEKGGIIKRDGILISAETKPPVLNVLKAECRRKRSQFYRLNRDFFIDDRLDRVVSGQWSVVRRQSHSPLFVFKGRRWAYYNLRTNLLGRHQYLNAACALAALEVLEETCPRMFLSGKGFRISESAVRKGLQGVFWPGRLELVSKKPLIVLDCAHNPAGAAVLRDALENGFNYKRLFLVLGIMADKDMKGMLSKLAPLAHTAILTSPKTERAASLDALYREIRPYAKSVKLIDNIENACRAAVSMSNSNDMICITGSVFTIGEAREFLLDTKMRKKRNEK